MIVLRHGLMMDASLWDGVIAELSAGHRCVAPTLPFGAHRHAMRADADLSLPGIARLVAELLDRLDLRDVTLVGNDTGSALVQLLIGDGAARVGRVVHGRRLADLFPDGWLVEIDDSYTLIPLDQPARLAQAIGELAPAAVQRPR